MTTKERILEEARTLSESEAHALLDFIGYLKYKQGECRQGHAERSGI